MNINCMLCGEVFLPDNYGICDGCSRPTHLETCGQLEPVYREGDIYFYFFCGRCNDDIPEHDWSESE